jgi:hypothetical protein
VSERFDATSKDTGVEGRSQAGEHHLAYGEGPYGAGFFGGRLPIIDDTRSSAVGLEGSRGTTG